MEAEIYFEKGIEKYKKGLEIINKFKSYNWVENEKEFLAIIKDRKLTYSNEKRVLFFGLKRGKFIKQYYLDTNFKGIKEEYYLSYENNCPYGCQYCYLREYYGHGCYIFYINIEDMFKELDEFNKKNVMISCGIMNDSLVYDGITSISKELIEYFNKREDLILELRTKSANIGNIIKIVPNKNILLSFTFSPQEIINLFEIRTASLKKRVDAAKRAQDAGYNIGIRIDPIINIENGEAIYKNMVKNIMENLDLSKIKDVGIGSLRYKKELKKKVWSEAKTSLFYDEFVTGIDGKERYFKSIRIFLYKTVISEIKKYGNFEIYLGMEPEYMWKEVL